jgi:hypothetical protein
LKRGGDMNVELSLDFSALLMCNKISAVLWYFYSAQYIKVSNKLKDEIRINYVE